jgi:hypothetical protein
LRLLEKREQPIDVLAKTILLLESITSQDVEQQQIAINLSKIKDTSIVNHPLDVIHDISSSELSILIEDIDSYIQLATMKQSEFLTYWTHLKETALAESRSRINHKVNKALHKSVLSDVHKLLAGKSTADLLTMEEEIKESIRLGEKVDVAYWEQVVDEVRSQRFRMLVTEGHDELLSRQQKALEQLTSLEPTLSTRQSTGNQISINDFKALTAEYVVSQIETCSLTREESLFLKNEQEQGCRDNEEVLGTRDVLVVNKTYSWQNEYTPIKPKYYIRVSRNCNVYFSNYYYKLTSIVL